MENAAINFQELTELALQARERAYVPYSHFAVGAALLCKMAQCIRAAT